MFRSYRLFVILSLVVVIGLVSCERQKPTITPKLQINKKSAEMGTPIEITYAFATNSEYVALFKDMTVFVHFVDPKKIRRFQDDHVPPKPTSEWRPGSNYNYTRTVFIPKNIPAGEYTVVAGIYSPSKGERMVLAGKQFTNRAYDLGTLLIEIPPREPLIQYTEGWHDPEHNPNDVSETWRWTAKEAILRVKNLDSDALLYLKFDGPSERFPKDAPQKLTVKVGDTEIETIPITSNYSISRKYNIEKTTLGTGKFVDVKLQVDKPFIPSSDGVSKDSRELGVRVYHLYLGKAAD